MRNIWFLSPLVPSKQENLALLSLYTFWGVFIFQFLNDKPFLKKYTNWAKLNSLVLSERKETDISHLEDVVERRFGPKTGIYCGSWSFGDNVNSNIRSFFSWNEVCLLRRHLEIAPSILSHGLQSDSGKKMRKNINFSGLELARVPRVPGTRRNSEHHLWHPRILRF